MFDTPLKLNVKINEDDSCPLENLTVFKRLVGSLLYLTMTRVDISHAVHIVSHFISNPHKLHLVEVHRILRYIKDTPGLWSIISFCIILIAVSIC